MWLIRFSKYLNSVSTATKYNELIKRIKRPEQFYEAISVLDAAYQFALVGFTIELDLKVYVEDKEKKPDIIILAENDVMIPVEVSQNTTSDREQRSSKTFAAIRDILFSSFDRIEYCCKLYKALSPNHLNDILLQVKALVEKVKNENKFNSISIDDVIDLGAAPKNIAIQLNKLIKWKETKNLNGINLQGPPWSDDEILRLKSKMNKENQQLPKDKAGILVIYNDDVFRCVDINYIINQLEEYLYEHRNLLFCILVGKSYDIDQMDCVIDKREHKYIFRTSDDGAKKQIIILYNKYCEYKVSDEITDLLYKAFTLG
jgi:hypothetical protein